MNIGLYQSAASLSALERWQDVTAQNITASQVTGYRKRTIEFSGVSMGEVQTDPARGRIGSGEGPESIFPKASFGLNFQAGENYPTGRPLDVAIEGEGFFELQLADGSRAYTRAGAFHISPERTLVTRDGLTVLGEGGNPIVLLPEGGELSVGHDGVLTQGDTQIGRLSLQRFASTDQVTAVAGGLFIAKPGVEPLAVETPHLRQAHLEGSNVTPLREMVALVQIARAYEANQKMITTQDQTLAQAIEKLG